VSLIGPARVAHHREAGQKPLRQQHRSGAV